MKINISDPRIYQAYGDIAKRIDYIEQRIDSGESLDEWILCGKESDQHPAHGEDVWLCFDWYPNKIGSYFNCGKKPERRIEKARWFLTYWEVNGCKAENISPIAWTRNMCKEHRKIVPNENKEKTVESATSVFSDGEEIVSRIKLPDGRIVKIASDKDLETRKVELFADDEKVDEVITYPAKPPLGITPRWLHDEKRIYEILDGMERYSQEQKVVPIDWITEAREIFAYLMSKKGYENG